MFHAFTKRYRHILTHNVKSNNGRAKRTSLAPTCLLAGIMASAMAAQPAFADTLIDNVNGVTVDENGKTIYFTGIVIDDNGFVAQLLERKDKRPDDVDYYQDAKGAYMLPGIVEGHAHVMGTGLRSMLLDLRDCDTLEDALVKISDFVRDNPGRPWILGGGWNQEKWNMADFPDAALLDLSQPMSPFG